MPPRTSPSSDAVVDRELLDPLRDVGAPTGRAAFRREPAWLRLTAVPPNFFAIAFGLAGLGMTWRAAEAVVDVPAGVADALLLLAAGVWVVLTAGLLLRWARRPAVIAVEVADPVLAPYLAVPPIVALLLAGGLAPHAPGASGVLALVALPVVVVAGGWLTGQWIAGPVDRDKMHPGYFLPTVAGGFVAANVLAVTGHRSLAWLCFGIGAVCWLQLGSVILDRLVTGPPLAPALIPTLAIEVAPPAVAGNAYFALQRGPDDMIWYGLAGFCVLSIVAQMRFVPLFRALPFAATFWALTFSYTSVAAYGIHWVARERPGSAAALTWATLAAATALVGLVAAASVRAMRAGRFFPGPSLTAEERR